MATHKPNASALAPDFPSIFESLDEPCLVLDAELTALAANEAYRKLAGQTVVGNSADEVLKQFPSLGPERAVIIRASLERVRTQKTADRTATVSLADSSDKSATRHWRYHHQPVFAPDGTLRFILQRLQDVSETEQLEAELESLRYSISHDLRAPLRAIDGFSQSLIEDYADKVDAGAQDYLKRVRAASQRLNASVDALLNLSRISRQPMRRERVDLSALVKSIAHRLQSAQPDRKLRLIVAEGAWANGDAALLQIALENLLDNAWKFTRRRDSATIEFGVRQQGSQTEYFLRDDGAGFDMAYAKKIFGIFQRFHPPADFEGIGAGLAITQRIVQRHGGGIRVEAALEKGATFYFKL